MRMLHDVLSSNEIGREIEHKTDLDGRIAKCGTDNVVQPLLLATSLEAHSA